MNEAKRSPSLGSEAELKDGTDLRHEAAAKRKSVRCCNKGPGRPVKEGSAMEYAAWSAAPLGGFGAPNKRSMACCGSHKNVANYGSPTKGADPCGKLEDRLHNFEQLVLTVLSKLDFSHCEQAEKDELSAALEKYIASMATRKHVDDAALEEEIRAELRAENQKVLERGFKEAYEVVLELRKALNEANALILTCAKHMGEARPGVPSELAAWLMKYAEKFISGPCKADVSDPLKTLVRGV